MKKSEMICETCISFDKRGDCMCHEKPIPWNLVADGYDPQKHWCTQGSWRHPYKSNEFLYWGQWEIIDHSKANALYEAWHRLRLEYDRPMRDQEQIQWQTSCILSRMQEFTWDQIEEILTSYWNEKEFTKFKNWYDNLMEASGKIVNPLERNNEDEGDQSY
jgi:hypothetical protein